MTSSDSADLFAEAAESMMRVVRGLGTLPPAVRAEALAAHVAHVYAAGLRLGSDAGGLPEAPPAISFPAEWPGLGRADRVTPTASDLLRGLWSDLDRGGRLPAELRTTWWRSTFTARWGALAVALLERLQAEIMEVRGTTPPPAPPAPAPTMLPSFTPAPPERRPTGRGRAASTTPKSVLGLRFLPSADGLLVQAVHPSGPAAGLLAAGDTVTHVDGVGTAGRDEASIAAILEGAPGLARRLRVAGSGEAREIVVHGVRPDDLAPAPAELRLLIHDRDAARPILDALPSLGFTLEESPDQEGLVVIRGPARAAAVLRQTLAEGADQGLWEVMEQV